MTTAVIDALLETLANIEAYADNAFDLDTATKVMEEAAATLRGADADERETILARAAALSLRTTDPERKEFLENLGENLGLVDTA